VSGGGPGHHRSARDSIRRRFDRLFEEVLEAIPQRVRALLDETPVVIEDRPSPQMMEQLGLDPGEDNLCGLHTGTPLTERSVHAAHDPPEMIHIFREGVVEEAGGWSPWQDDDGNWWGGPDRIKHEIRVTLLHEIGHHFGLEDEDLEGLGYG
jgi:predicted Zn-dependent protease with MMP-like domain